MEIDIKKLLPKFIMNDKNGYALAKAIEAGIKEADRIISDAMGIYGNVDAMPEWRLDMVAWENDLLYDYTADAETKRKWIRDKENFYARYGTPEGMLQYLRAEYDTVKVEEWWQYNGAPYHFRVVVTGERTDEGDAWVRRAIEKTKNVRSVLDSITFSGGGATSAIKTGTAVSGVYVIDAADSM